MDKLRDKTAIVGIGHTEFSMDSGRSEFQLACEASLAAIEDAGLRPEDIDGIAKYEMDSTEETALAGALGIQDLGFTAMHGYGGSGSCAVVQLAAMAVASGVAQNVLVFRALNERSGVRYGTDTIGAGTTGTYGVGIGYMLPYGMMVPASFASFSVHRYFHDYAIDRDKLGWVAVTQREHAQRNPNAYFYGRPMTMDDYLESRWIVRPTFRLYDCTLESDGAAALVISSAERARDLKQRPVYISAAATATGEESGFTSFFSRDPIYDYRDVELVARKLYAQSGMTHQDVDVALIYDAFSIQVPRVLESYGWCKQGEGVDFCAEGRISASGGEIPVNTHGGHLSEAYIHGQNHIIEAVRQLRGQSCNQVEAAEVALVTGGAMSAMLVRR